MIQAFYRTPWFKVGQEQACVLAPWLFAAALSYALRDIRQGVQHRLQRILGAHVDCSNGAAFSMV
eukprot:6056168-Prorocentrum_lima.AAC.1